MFLQREDVSVLPKEKMIVTFINIIDLTKETELQIVRLRL